MDGKAPPQTAAAQLAARALASAAGVNGKAQTALLRPERVESVSFEQFLAETPPEPEWIWQDYVAPGSTTLLASLPKVGKTTLLFTLLEAASRGDAFLGRATRPTRALILTEEPPGPMADKASRWSLPGSRLLPRHAGREVPWPQLVRQSVEECHQHGLNLLVVDTLAKWAGYSEDDENSSGPVLQALEPLQAAADTGLAVLILAHLRKSGGTHGAALRGSNALLGEVDIEVELLRAKNQPNVRWLKAVSRYRSTPDTLRAVLEGDQYVGQESLAYRPQTQADQLLEALAKLGASTVAHLVEETGLPRSTVQRRLHELEQDDKVVSQPGENPLSDPAIWDISRSRCGGG